MGRTRRNNDTYCNECNKTAHASIEAACTARRGLVRSGKHRTKPGVLHVYPCPHGNGWHVGHRNHR